MRAKGILQDTGGWSKIYKDVVGHLEVSFLHSTITSINYFYKAFHPSNCPFFGTYPPTKMSPWCVILPCHCVSPHYTLGHRSISSLLRGWSLF